MLFFFVRKKVLEISFSPSHMIQEINAHHSLHARIGHFVDVIKQELRCFSSCSWAHCCRESNCITHVIAKEASSTCFSRTLLDEMSLFISDVVCRSLDCNLVIFYWNRFDMRSKKK
jgi:hypothetical protein